MSRTHLTDLFKTGEDVTLEVFNPADPDNPIVYKLYFRKPTVGVMEEIMAKARAKQARARRALLDPEHDEHVAIMEEIGQMSASELIRDLVRFEESMIRRRANQEVLYGQDENGEYRWGKEGQDYMDLLEAIQQRRDEIAAHNDGLSDEEQSLRIDIGADEEYMRLSKELSRFDEQVEELFEKMMEEERKKHEGKTVETLRKELAKQTIETKASLAFWQEYRVLQIFHSTRYPDDHTKLYFDSPDDILDLPEHVRGQLFSLYDEFEQDLGDVKNVPSPPIS